MSPSLRIQNLSTGYHVKREAPHTISSGLNLQIHQGELVMLMGPNGSGKSTLMHTIAGLIPPLEGSVLIEGKAINKLDLGERAKLISLVLTERITSSHLKVRDVVRVGRYPHTGYLGSLSRVDERIVDEAMEQCGLGSLSHRSLAELSDGERQRTMIARALAQQTPLILLDEPTAHLDLPTRLEVVLMLRQLARDTKRSILVSTHELNLALSWADTIWLLDREGKMRCACPEDLVLQGTFEQVFGNSSLLYNPETGEFNARIQTHRQIGITGEGLEYQWSRRALARLGYETVCDSSTYPQVICHKDAWQLTTHHGENHTVQSIEQLIKIISQTCKA